MPGIVPFQLAIPEADLIDLRDRLSRTRWPESETIQGWRQGAPLLKIRELCDYWLHDYDWRRCEAMLNGLGQFQTQLDGLDLHFIHVRSPEPDALPLLITHGWPGSVIEFHKIFSPLADPAAHGGNPRDAFHIVAPSLPGYGFSSKPHQAGWGVERIARTWIALMSRLGYDHYVAQGGDWGSMVTTAIGAAQPRECLAIHLNMPVILPDKQDMYDLTIAEKAALNRLREYNSQDSGYWRQQKTRPQTLGYGLTDSPVGQAAWIYEKFYFWTDNDGTPESVLTLDEMLDNIMLYWLPGTAASSARLYWESFGSYKPPRLEIPVGVSLFPKEIFTPSRRWAERGYNNIIHWNELDKGGHFAAFEQPDLFVTELRDCFRKIR